MPQTAVRPAAEAAPEQPAFSDEALLLTDAPVPGGAATRRVAGTFASRIVSDWAELEALQEAWEELASTSAEPNPFYEPGCYLPALRSFARRERVRWCSCSGAICSAASFRWSTGAAGSGSGGTPYCYLTAPLLRRAAARRHPLLVRYASARAPWSASRMSRDGLPGLHLVDELNEREWPALVSQAYTRAVLRRAPQRGRLSHPARFAGKRRKSSGASARRLAELAAHHRRAAPGANPAAWVDEFLALEAQGWKGREGVDSARDRTFVSRWRQALPAGASCRCRPAPRWAAVALKMTWSEERALRLQDHLRREFAASLPACCSSSTTWSAPPDPALRWMDSCAAPNRFMINHLWPIGEDADRLSSPRQPAGPFAVAMIPLLHSSPPGRAA